VKYTDPGGILTLVVSATADHIAFEVRDNGSGISQDLLPYVFEPFVQSDRTLDRAQGGLGIGLSLVKGLIEMHGGTVCAVSDGPRRGSTFTIRLPRIAQPESQQAEVARLEVPRRRILIVDDNVDAADSLGLLLESNGHEVKIAYSAALAIESVERMSPDVVLLDIGLPEIDGYELAEKFRCIPHLNGIRLIAVTGYGQKQDRQRTRAAGFDDHLVKPVDLPALNRVLAGRPAGHEAG
jgi:CheY-like chemotaxis protein